MQEIFETFSDENKPAGLVPRSEVHKLGLWHRASNVFLFRTDGRLITQRRHDSKDVYPGAWDLSVAEHLKPGEDYMAGAIRGLNEELGIDDVILEPCSEVIRAKLVIPEMEIKDFELQMCFRGISDTKLTPQSSEVAETRLFQLSELKALMAASPGSFTPWFLGRANDIGLFN